MPIVITAQAAGSALCHALARCRRGGITRNGVRRRQPPHFQPM